jgi:hypothetical protein
MEQTFYGRIDNNGNLTTFMIGLDGKLHLDDIINLSGKKYTITKPNVIVETFAVSEVKVNDDTVIIKEPIISQTPPCRRLIIQKAGDLNLYMDIEIK